MLANATPCPDLLVSVRQPLGGVMTVEYQSSAGLVNTRLPFVMHVVKRISLDEASAMQ